MLCLQLSHTVSPPFEQLLATSVLRVWEVHTTEILADEVLSLLQKSLLGKSFSGGLESGSFTWSTFGPWVNSRLCFCQVKLFLNVINFLCSPAKQTFLVIVISLLSPMCRSKATWYEKRHCKLSAGGPFYPDTFFTDRGKFSNFPQRDSFSRNSHFSWSFQSINILKDSVSVRIRRLVLSHLLLYILHKWSRPSFLSPPHP